MYFLLLQHGNVALVGDTKDGRIECINGMQYMNLVNSGVKIESKKTAYISQAGQPRAKVINQGVFGLFNYQFTPAKLAKYYSEWAMYDLYMSDTFVPNFQDTHVFDMTRQNGFAIFSIADHVNPARRVFYGISGDGKTKTVWDVMGVTHNMPAMRGTDIKSQLSSHGFRRDVRRVKDDAVYAVVGMKGQMELVELAPKPLGSRVKITA